jgi:hypothetical protein
LKQFSIQIPDKNVLKGRGRLNIPLDTCHIRGKLMNKI